MNLLKNLFGKKDEPIKSNDDFWAWFLKNEKAFFQTVSQMNNVEKDFLDKLSAKLKEFKDGFSFLTGMTPENKAELIFTPDGAVKNVVFVEELVAESLELDNWVFTALKPAIGIKDAAIEMAGYTFSSKNLHFYAEEQLAYPDEIDITIIHNDFTHENTTIVTHGTYIFLDNFLGELNFLETIDHLTIIGKQEAEKDLIHIEKLPAYLIWRQKEFIEKYQGTHFEIENDNYISLEATLANGLPLIAIINRGLLNWDSKASHPWILAVKIKYDGTGNNGLPDNETYALLNNIEDEMMEILKDADEYLNVGRQTADNAREIYFACKDFRKSSKVPFEIQQKYAKKLDVSYDMYKDKYWQSFNRFIS